MGPVSVLYTAFASISLFACLLQLFLSYKKRGDILILVSSILSFAVFIRFSLVLLCSAPLGFVDHHLTLLRCQLILTQVVTVCMLGVIFYLLKDGRKLFFLLYVFIICVLLILSFILPDDILFGRNEGIYYHNLPDVENLPVIVIGFTWWRTITDLAILMFVISTIILFLKKLDSINYGNIIVFFSGLGLMLFAAFYDQLVDLGHFNSIYLLPIAIFLFYMILNFIPFLYLLKEVAENNIVIQQEKKWQNLVNEADIIVVGLNRMGLVEFINPYFFELTGYQENEVMGKDWFEFFIPSKEYFNVQGAFIEVLESEFHPHYFNPILTKNKEEKMVHWFNVSTRDQNGKIIGSLSIGVDVTEDFREKKDLIKKLREAEDLIDKIKNSGQNS